MGKSDIEIAQQTKLDPIVNIAKKIGIDKSELYLFGEYIAKVNVSLLKKLENKKDGKLVLVTAMTPTPAGEGKTTTTVGLGQSLWKLGKKAIICFFAKSIFSSQIFPILNTLLYVDVKIKTNA